MLTHSCRTLCDPMNCSLPGSSVHEIFQARILEWVAISYSIYICVGVCVCVCVCIYKYKSMDRKIFIHFEPT